MTTAPTEQNSTAEIVADANGGQAVSFPRVVRSEWIKFRTLRSTLSVLAAAVGGMILIGLIVGYNTRHLTANIQGDDHVPSSTLQGYYLGQLLIGALGVLFVTGEYGTGMIRSTFAAVPRRIPVLAAKAAVFTAVVLVTMIVTCLVVFVAAQGLISSSRSGYSLGDPGVLRVVIGTGIYLTLIGLLGMMIGWIVRSTPGAIVAYIAVILVLPVLFGNVLGQWGRDVAQYLPSDAGGSYIRSLAEPPSLAPWTGLAVLAGWVVVSAAIAIVQLRSRDA